MGRRKRSIAFRPLSLTKTKQKQQQQLTSTANATLTAQLDKFANRTTNGNLAFVVSRQPISAYIWTNPLAKVFTRNMTNKSIQWQFGKVTASQPTNTGGAGNGSPSAAGGAGSAATRPAATPAASAGHSSCSCRTETSRRRATSRRRRQPFSDRLIRLAAKGFARTITSSRVIQFC